jgi:dolichol-phosphate mannosyltransferase
MDGIFSFSSAPIRLITILGLIGFGFATIYTLNVLIGYFMNGTSARGFTTLAILISFFSSIILVCLGVIGEYIVRIYDEVRGRPYVVIERTVNV